MTSASIKPWGWSPLTYWWNLDAHIFTFQFSNTSVHGLWELLNKLKILKFLTTWPRFLNNTITIWRVLCKYFFVLFSWYNNLDMQLWNVTVSLMRKKQTVPHYFNLFMIWPTITYHAQNVLLQFHRNLPDPGPLNFTFGSDMPITFFISEFTT